MKQWMEEGRIGDTVEVITTFGFPMVELGANPEDTSHWGNRMSSGGGALSQFGCYNVNLSQYVYGQMPEEILGKSQILPIEDGSDANTAFVLSYNGGRQHTLASCSWDARTISDSRISGKTGEIVIGRPFFAPFKAELFTHKGAFWYNDLDETFVDPYGETGREGFKYQFDAVSEYVVSGMKESPEVSPQYSMDLAYTMERIRKTLKMI